MLSGPPFSLLKKEQMLQKLLIWLGFGLCHQLPERSYVLGGLQAPVCVRDTGIYVGFILGFLLLVAIHPERPRELPRWYVWATMAAFLAFMGWDGITSYSGIRQTVNELRLITGLGVGFSVAVIILPMINDELWRQSSGVRVLDALWRFFAWLAAIPIAWFFMTFIGPLMGQSFIILTALTIPATLTVINMVIVCMFRRFDRRAESVRDVLLPAAIAFGMSIVQIAAAAWLRALLLGAAG